MLQGKTVVLGVTGSIAAYKIASGEPSGEASRRCARHYDAQCHAFYHAYYL